MQLAVEPEQLEPVARTEPAPDGAAAPDTVKLLTANVAVSVCAAVIAFSEQGLVVPEHVPPPHPARWYPVLGVAVTDTTSPVVTVQLVALQDVVWSLTIAVPWPEPATLALTVNWLAANDAVSVSPAVSEFSVHELVSVPVQLPRVHALKW